MRNKIKLKVLVEKLESISKKKVIFKEADQSELIGRMKEIISQQVIKSDVVFNKNYSEILTTLGNIEKISGDLVIENCGKLIDLGNLKSVHGGLFITNSSIKSLGNLEYIGSEGGLISNCPNLVTINSLKTVNKGYLEIVSCPNLQDLGELETASEIAIKGESKIDIQNYINYFKQKGIKFWVNDNRVA